MQLYFNRNNYLEDGTTNGSEIFTVYVFLLLWVLPTVLSPYIQIWEEFQETKR